MASSSLTCFSSAMNDLQLLENLYSKSQSLLGRDSTIELHVLNVTKVRLGLFRTFLLYARMWGNDEEDSSLGALVSATEDAFSKLRQRIRTFYLTCLEDGHRLLSSGVLADGLYDGIFNVDEKLKERFLVSLDGSTMGASRDSLVKKDDLMEFMNSVLDYLEHAEYFDFEGLFYKPAQAMLGFFRNSIRFFILHGIEDGQLGPLLSHAKFATLNAACLDLSFSANRELMQKISCLEPQAHETCVSCVQVLIASKLSTQSLREADLDEHFLIEFVDSLLFYQCETINTEAWPVILLKDQLHILWEELIFLRAILKGNHPKFDDNMRDLTRLLLCDAGLVLFSLRDRSVKDMDVVSFKDFVQKIEIMKAKFSEICPQTFSSSSPEFPRTYVLGFLHSLSKYMMDLTSREDASSMALVNYPIPRIRKELDFLSSNFMEKIVDARYEDEGLQALWNHVGKVAYKVEFLIDSLLVRDISDSRPMLFDSILKEIKIIKAEGVKALDAKALDPKVKEVTQKSSHIKPQGSMPLINTVVVGFEDEAATIINRLKRGSSHLQIVPIVGLAGLGKTTLAKKVYNDSQVMSYFYKLAWVTVSQEYHKKHLLLEILTCIKSGLSEQILKMSEEDLALEVRKGLQRSRYLIVLDDIWKTEVWNDLEAIFPDNQNGSRVILTSRHHDIVASRKELNEGPLRLRPLNPDESWDLLNMMLYHGRKDLTSPKFCELRMQIMKICQGLPLTIVILAGILENEDQNCWEKVVESLSVVSSSEQCTATLELSYQNLPDYLKPCFLYFGAFPEDHEHHIEDLICLWFAEGFVQETKARSAEDVANDYLMGLIGRSLVIVCKQRSIGGVEACRVHDLLHNFCVRKATEENFLQFVHDGDESYTLCMPRHLRRLCINSTPEYFCKLRLFAPTVRSISLSSVSTTYKNITLIARKFKLVRVLDFSKAYLDNRFPYLGNGFPTALRSLGQLRYLAIRTSRIPSSIANLLHLETLVVHSHNVELSNAIWSMEKLRHLLAKDLKGRPCEIYFLKDDLENAPSLCTLNTLFGVLCLGIEYFCKRLRSFPNIRKLSFKVRYEDYSIQDSSIPFEFLDLVGLESLSLHFNARGFSRSVIGTLIEIKFPKTIRELTLSDLYLPWSKMSAIEDLPNLEVLNLLNWAFAGDVWEIKEEGFAKVQFLKLSSLDIVKWTTASDCDDCFPSLRILVLQFCTKLEEIPSLGSSPLEAIEVRFCPNSADLIKQVQEEQRDSGNYELKIVADW